MHEKPNTAKAALIMLALLTPLAVDAARPLGPPIEELVSGYNIVMAARAIERVDAGRVRFERVVPYYGEPAESIVLRTGEANKPLIETGQTYILGYTAVTSDSQFREVKFEDPDGPKIVGIRGVGRQAVFEDTEHLRFLFGQAVKAEPAAPSKALEALLAQVQLADEQARVLMVLELMLRPDLIAILDEADGRVVRDIVADAGVPIETRDFLLQTAPRFPAPARAEWLTTAQRTVVEAAPVQFDLASPMPSYVRTAVRGLKSTGSASDLPALRRLLASNAPGVAKAALETMDSLDAAATLLVAKEIRSDPSLAPETRLTLDRYISQSQNRDAS